MLAPAASFLLLIATPLWAVKNAGIEMRPRHAARRYWPSQGWSYIRFAARTTPAFGLCGGVPQSAETVCLPSCVSGQRPANAGTHPASHRARSAPADLSGTDSNCIVRPAVFLSIVIRFRSCGAGIFSASRSMASAIIDSNAGDWGLTVRTSAGTPQLRAWVPWVLRGAFKEQTAVRRASSELGQKRAAPLC